VPTEYSSGKLEIQPRNTLVNRELAAATWLAEGSRGGTAHVVARQQVQRCATGSRTQRPPAHQECRAERKQEVNDTGVHGDAKDQSGPDRDRDQGQQERGKHG
jgi:hypothetical protein